MAISRSGRVDTAASVSGPLLPLAAAARRMAARAQMWAARRARSKASCDTGGTEARDGGQSDRPSCVWGAGGGPVSNESCWVVIVVLHRAAGTGVASLPTAAVSGDPPLTLLPLEGPEDLTCTLGSTTRRFVPASAGPQPGKQGPRPTGRNTLEGSHALCRSEAGTPRRSRGFDTDEVALRPATLTRVRNGGGMPSQMSSRPRKRHGTVAR
jgi:hypothetical protein